MDCVLKFKIDFSKADCLPPCEGLMITSYEKNHLVLRLDGVIKERIKDYEAYKGEIKFPSKIRGLIVFRPCYEVLYDFK